MINEAIEKFNKEINSLKDHKIKLEEEWKNKSDEWQTK
jgi:hypothetical protein